MNQRESALGTESKGLGVNVWLGSVAEPLGKSQRVARDWKGIGPDPYLSGVAMMETISSTQSSGTQARTKAGLPQASAPGFNRVSALYWQQARTQPRFHQR